jgi:hypothetical protein
MPTKHVGSIRYHPFINIQKRDGCVKTRILLKTIGDFVYGMIFFVSAFFFSSLLVNLINRIVIERSIHMSLVFEEIQTAYLIVYYYGLIWVPLTFIGGYISAIKGKRDLMIYVSISMISYVLIYIMRIFLMI